MIPLEKPCDADVASRTSAQLSLAHSSCSLSVHNFRRVIDARHSHTERTYFLYILFTPNNVHVIRNGMQLVPNITEKRKN